MSDGPPVVLGCFVIPRSTLEFHELWLRAEGGSGSRGMKHGDDVELPWLRALCSCGWQGADHFTLEDNAYSQWNEHAHAVTVAAAEADGPCNAEIDQNGQRVVCILKAGHKAPTWPVWLEDDPTNVVRLPVHVGDYDRLGEGYTLEWTDAAVNSTSHRGLTLADVAASLVSPIRVPDTVTTEEETDPG